MQNFKRILATVCAVVMLVLCCAGCSTPDNAMTIDGYTVSTGEYLANMYNMFYQAYYNGGLYYTAYYNQYTADQVWAMEQTYGEGDTALKLKLDDYIKQVTKDSLIRQQAVKSLMKEYGISLSEEDVKEIDKQMSTYDNSLIAFGFNAENYKKMMTAYNFEEAALFYGLYNEGGQKAVAETDVRSYFDTNYLVYKTFTLSLVDSKGADLPADEIAKLEAQMQTYMDMHKAGKDALEIYKKYLADEEAKKEAEKKDTEKKDVTSTATDEKEEEKVEWSFSSLVATSENANADLAKAIQGLKAGEATTVKYNPSSSSKVLAFVIRYDHSDEYKSKDEFYKDTRDSVLYTMKGDEFEEMLKEPIKQKTEKTEVNDRAMDMCDPKNLLTD